MTKLTRIAALSFASKVGHKESESNAFKIAADLASTMKTQYINKTIAEDSVIRMQDDLTVFSGLAASPIGSKTVIAFLSNNYEQLIKYNFGKDEILADMVKYASGHVYNKDDLEVYNQHSFHAVTMGISQIIVYDVIRDTVRDVIT
ncbi:hypothetical protein LSTR_LSTR017453 [Laodelphax striatellus]|uniref:Uncharacterized protein n=1 Tax=Laodelphax striatellus TaxID=195883 RepID=A0A482XSQ0_LAOST|nr:hypothetical protein LSTR_LSTR017453 [Laodelphax striatellus]